MQFKMSSNSGRGIVGRIMTTAFGLFFAFIGFQFVKAEWRNLHKTKDMQEWSHTVCTIEQVRSEDQGEDFRLSISYSYQVHGAKYNSTRYSPNGDLTRETIGEIKEAEKQFAKDRQLPCYYDPDAPGNAVLKVPSVRSAWTSLGFSMIFPVIGLTVAGFSWKPRRKQSARVETSDPRPARSPKIFLIIFGLIFATVGGAMLKPLLITPLQKTREAQNWNPIPATVVSSKVKSHSSDDGTTYSVYIAYRYEVDGEQYHGDRYTFMGGLQQRV